MNPHTLAENVRSYLSRAQTELPVYAAVGTAVPRVNHHRNSLRRGHRSNQSERRGEKYCRRKHKRRNILCRAG